MRRLSCEMDAMELAEEDIIRIYGPEIDTPEGVLVTDGMMAEEGRVIDAQVRFGHEEDENGNIACEHLYGDCRNNISCSWCIDCQNCQEVCGCENSDGCVGYSTYGENLPCLYSDYLAKLEFIREVRMGNSPYRDEVLRDWKEVYGKVS